jgi:membrane fusion protein, heavy metal efflux system
MKPLALLLAGAALVAACQPHSHDGNHGAHEHGHEHGAEDERPALSFTHWTDASELFMELPALVTGQESACAAHLTRLQPFSALASGSVAVVLRGPAGDERFESAAPSVPGIFRPVAKPQAPGPRRLIVEVRAEGLSVEHDLGEVRVFDSVEAARSAIPEEPEVAGRIPFLKEQQWPIAFDIVPVLERPLRPSLRVTGTLRARGDGELSLRAPVAGRVATSGRAFPLLGERVAVNDVLGLLAPRLESADLASLDLAVTSAQLELRFAERERQRLEALRGEGAVPERRVQDAVHAAERAQAALAAAQRRLEQFRRVERTAGRAEGTVELRAPLAGTVTAVDAAPGAFVEAGAQLLRVTDLTQLWLEARVPAAEAQRLGTPSGGWFYAEGSETMFELPAAALAAHGQALELPSRTLPLLFAFDNSSARLPLGSFCSVFLALGDERRAPALPLSAIVEDGGVDVAFVQIEGEAFERRTLRLGVRERGFVEVLGGVSAGERVVSRGAWSVKLAASSSAVPAHGHAH